jgi:hypothetical protein
MHAVKAPSRPEDATSGADTSGYYRDDARAGAPTEPFALPAGISYDGVMSGGDLSIALFTDHRPDSPSYRATIALPSASATPVTLAALLAATAAKFART